MSESATTDYATLADEIAGWLRDQLATAGAGGFVVGLSGGVDSATVCALCCRAVGVDKVLGAIMPSHSNPLDAEHAALVAETFGVETVRVDLSPITDVFLGGMPTGPGGKGTAGEWRAADDRAQLASANVKPRLRMTTLYYLANLRNALVVGTGNKSEAMIGYFTKYGDGGVDLLPIVDLYKHQVRGLARELGVPDAVITKPPSAGLWHGQTDEGEIGMTYDDLDQTLAALEREATRDSAQAHLGNEDQPDQTRRDTLLEREATREVAQAHLDRVKGMMRSSEHKRRPAAAFRQSAP